MNFALKAKGPAEAKNRIGLDIGSYAVKMLEISGPPDRPALNGFGMKKIAGLSKDDAAAAIKSLADEIKSSQKEACISVSGPSVTVRFVSMPKMNEDELKNAMRFEAEKFIPFDMNDCVFDFQILKKAPAEGVSPPTSKTKTPPSVQSEGLVKPRDEGENKINILFVAAKKEHVAEKVELVKRAGFSVKLVDVDSLAIANAFAVNFPKLDPAKASALLNIGAKSTNLSITRGDMPYFVRDSDMGTSDFNEAASKNLLNNLLDDLKLSLSYYENQSGMSIDDIYISGGACGIAGLDEALENAFGAKPRRWNPLGFLDIVANRMPAGAIEGSKHHFAVAAGLALR